MKRVVFVILACAVLALGSAVGAVMRGLSTEEMTREADLVVEGTVDHVRSYWSDDGRKILSSAQVTVSETVRGRITQQTVTVEYEGGEVGGVGMKVSDQEAFKKGERILVFLQSSKSSRDGEIHTLVGRSQGKYTIGKDQVARKSGYSLSYGAEAVDNNLDVEALKAKIRNVK